MCVCLSYVLIRETLAGWGSAQLTRGCGCTRKDRELTSEIRCCHVCRPCPHNSHSEIIADWFEQSPNTISLVHHYKNQSLFPHSRHRAESNGKKKNNRASVLSLAGWIILPWAWPGGNSCREPSSTQMLPPFCICFFQTFPQPYLWYILALACSCRLNNLCI